MVAVDVLVMVVVVKVGLCVVEGAGVADVVGGAATTTVEDDRDEATSVVVVERCVTEDGGVEGGEGVTTTVAVELSKQPPVTQAYPGMQQPPPG